MACPMTRPTSILLLCAAGLLTACREDLRDANVDPVVPDVAMDSSGGSSSTTDEPASSDDGPEVRLDLPPGDDTTTAATDGTCAAFSATGAVVPKPADIIVVVDNSPSMVDETNAVQENLNAFSQQIVGAGIDIRVLLMTSYPDPNAAEQIDTGVCIDPPLGGGGCPTEDDNQPIFAHMQQIIGSEHALAKILSTHANWAPMMRPDSVKHIIVVSDDDSYVSAADFDAQFRALDESYADYVFHGIVSTSDCPASGAVGEQYLALAEMTGGVIGDLCDQQFQPTFDVLSTAVTSGTTLACEWPLPDAPEGKTIDPETVEILLEIDGEVVAPPRLDGVEGCVAGEHGWYYDDPDAPTMLVACPATCAAVTAAASAELDIDVGCASFPAG
jgi:hypothetical protein